MVQTNYYKMYAEPVIGNIKPYLDKEKILQERLKQIQRKDFDKKSPEKQIKLISDLYFDLFMFYYGIYDSIYHNAKNKKEHEKFENTLRDYYEQNVDLEERLEEMAKNGNVFAFEQPIPASVRNFLPKKYRGIAKYNDKQGLHLNDGKKEKIWFVPKKGKQKQFDEIFNKLGRDWYTKSDIDIFLDYFKRLADIIQFRDASGDNPLKHKGAEILRQELEIEEKVLPNKIVRYSRGLKTQKKEQAEEKKMLEAEIKKQEIEVEHLHLRHFKDAKQKLRYELAQKKLQKMQESLELIQQKHERENKEYAREVKKKIAKDFYGLAK